MRTTAKPVIIALRAHILEAFEEEKQYLKENEAQDVTTLQLLREQIEHMKYGNRTTYQTALDWVEGGALLIYHDEVKDFLNNLGINPTNQEYTYEKSWRLYCHLIAREVTKAFEGVK